MLLGAHVSVAGGLAKAFDRGEALGCTAIQIFSKNQMQWKAAPLQAGEIHAFRERFERSSIQSVLIHDSYLINLASPDPTNLEKSRQAFADEMRRATALGVPYLVFHPGSHMGAGETTGLDMIIESLNRMLQKCPDFSGTLLLENTAGQGTNLGWRFEHLAYIINGVERQERLGVCIDTAHAFAAGYDMRTADAVLKTLDEFSTVVGWTKLMAFHFNDSKKPLGSRVDRHNNIGHGELGVDGFRYLMNHPDLENIPKILETPGGDTWFGTNLALLRSLIQ